MNNIHPCPADKFLHNAPMHYALQVLEKQGDLRGYGRIYQILNENLIESAGLSIRLFLRIL